MRAALTQVHRYAGLVIAVFLIIAGLTGSLLAWYSELDAWINPDVMTVQAPPGQAQPLSPFELRQRLEAELPFAVVNWLELKPRLPNGSLSFYIDAKSPDPTVTSENVNVELTFDEVFVDPYTGIILGTRKWGDISQGLINLMPFVYRLHYSLALGDIGVWIFGVVALIWTLDCFVSIYLTFPARKHRAGSDKSLRNWLSRWKAAWQVRWHGGSYKVNFDLHRAGGLWPWVLLLILAWSSVAFNLYDEVYRPVSGTFLSFQERPLTVLPDRKPERATPDLGWQAGYEQALRHLHEQADFQGFEVLFAERMSYHPQKNAFRLMARSDRDINNKYAQTEICIDATTGALLGLRLPIGAASGDTLTTWITTLHMAHIWGTPFRIVITLSGIVIVVLSVTGIVIWWRKRSARRRSALRR